jgi:hypothetical protein
MGVKKIQSEINRYNQRVSLICLMLAAFVLFTDYITGRYIQFPITFIFPVGIAAWNDRKIMAYSFVFLLPAARIIFHFPWRELDALPVGIINSLISMITLLIYAYLISRLARQKKELEREVIILEGILRYALHAEDTQ